MMRPFYSEIHAMPTLARPNVTLHYELDGEGPPAVYITGFGTHTNSVNNRPVRRALAAHYTTLSVDNRGSGQTVVHEEATVTIADMADDIAAVMEHHQMGAAHVLGISMGGSIALTLALRHREKVRSMVVCVAAALSLNDGRTGFLLNTVREMRGRGVPRDIVNRFTAVYLLSEYVFLDEGFIQAWVNAPQDPLEQTAEGFAQQYDAISGYNTDDYLSQIRVPTLVVSSPDDMLVPPRYQDSMAEKIPNAKIKRYPGGHIFMFLPMYNQQFYEDIFAFWAAH
jgi:pimeloyl-ACP methyl ester carboxylesterase